MTFPSPTPPRKGPSGPEWVYPTASNQVGNPSPLPSKEGDVLVVQADGTLAPQPASTTLTHLTSIMFVDGNTTVATANQNGNDEAPFKTISQALTACPAGGAILITAGIYAEDLNITKDVILQAIGTTSEGIADFNNLSSDFIVSTQDIHVNVGLSVILNSIEATKIIGIDNTITVSMNLCTLLIGDGTSITNTGGADYPNIIANNSTISGTANLDFVSSNNSVWKKAINHTNTTGSNNCYFQNSNFIPAGANLVLTFAGLTPGTVELDEISNANFLRKVSLVNGIKDIRGDEATLALITPQVVAGAGGGGFITLNQEDGSPFTYDASGLTANQKLEVGIDATTINETTLAITELRANRSYWLTGGVLTLLNDSTVFVSGDLQFAIVGTDLDLQGNQAAALGDTKRFVGKVYVKVVDV